MKSYVYFFAVALFVFGIALGIIIGACGMAGRK